MSTALQCGTRRCDTNNLTLDTPVIVAVQHSDAVKVCKKVNNLYNYVSESFAARVNGQGYTVDNTVCVLGISISRKVTHNLTLL